MLRKVLITQDFISAMKDVHIQELFKLVFASTMVIYSNYSYEPGLSQRVSSGKPVIYDFPVTQAIAHKLAEMIDDIIWMQSRLRNSTLKTSVINNSFFITLPLFLQKLEYNAVYHILFQIRSSVSMQIARLFVNTTLYSFVKVTKVHLSCL